MKVYLDHAATTPVDSRVLKAMLPYFSEKFGNASSLHSWGQEAKQALERAREQVAKVINAEPSEIIFTSGGTESDNTALKGLLKKGDHLITTRIEHPAILDVCKYLERQGIEVTYLKVDKNGSVSPKDVESAIRKNTKLVSIMHGNNEIGTIQPIGEIGNMCRKRNIFFHTDAVQTFGKVPIDVKRMGIDLLSASSHKIYGPKGIGCLYVRRGVKVEPLLHGGGHEGGRRSTTENVAGAVGFGEACRLALKDMAKEAKREEKLRDLLVKEILKVKGSWLNGHPTKRLPGNANFGFKFIEGESIVMYLDMRGIGASTGSACSTKELKPSHVLTAIGLKPEDAHGSLRITLGRSTTEEGIRYTAKAVKEVVQKLREISPFKKREY